jgi:hypothetical protein
MRFLFFLSNILYDIWNINVFGERVETFCQKAEVIVFVKAPLKPKKAIEVMLYRFVHGYNANMIVNRFNVKIFIMHKYVDICC